MTEKYSNLNTKYQKTTNLLFYCFSAFTFIVIVWSFLSEVKVLSLAKLSKPSGAKIKKTKKI